MATVSTDQVWRRLERATFLVLGMVNAHGQPRTVGVVPRVHEGQVWFGCSAGDWKLRYLTGNPAVSVTVPWQRLFPPVPPATITFQGTTTVHLPAEAPAGVLRALTRGLREVPTTTRLVAVTPTSDALTYGLGVSVLGMLNTEKARGRAPLAGTGR